MGSSLVAACGGTLSSACTGFSLWCLLFLRSMGSSEAAARGLNCSTARVVFPGQGSNPCLLHWQAEPFLNQLLLLERLCVPGSAVVSGFERGRFRLAQGYRWQRELGQDPVSGQAPTLSPTSRVLLGPCPGPPGVIARTAAAAPWGPAPSR